jgi:hypothetical protein
MGAEESIPHNSDSRDCGHDHLFFRLPAAVRVPIATDLDLGVAAVLAAV